MHPDCQGKESSYKQDERCVKRLRRGLCYPHYRHARRLVLKGFTTWELLVARGKCLADARSKPIPEDWFLKE